MSSENSDIINFKPKDGLKFLNFSEKYFVYGCVYTE